MEPCPYGKRGDHRLSAVIPGDEAGDLTLFCEVCGALRRVPVMGRLLHERLDDLDADALARLVQGD